MPATVWTNGDAGQALQPDVLNTSFRGSTRRNVVRPVRCQDGVEGRRCFLRDVVVAGLVEMAVDRERSGAGGRAGRGP